MKVHRIPFAQQAYENERGKRENHLPRRHHRGRKLRRARFHHHVRVSRARRAHHDRDAAPERHEALEIEQLRANDRHAAEREDRAEHSFPFQRFAGETEVREEKAERRDGRLQNRGQPRGNVLFTPKEQSVIDRESEDTSERQERVIREMPRKKAKASCANPGEHARRNNKTKRHKGDWWQISEPNLDCQPGGTPDHAQSQPRPEHSQRKTRWRRDRAGQGR